MESFATFQVGDRLVHPVHGLCRVHAIERMRIRDEAEDCYVFLVGSGRHPTKVLVPVGGAHEAGLHRPITKQEAEEALRVLQSPAPSLGQSSKEQIEGLSARLTHEDLVQVAEAVRDLVASGVNGWQSPPEGGCVSYRKSEQALLRRALERLIEELAYAQGVSRRTIEERIRGCLERTRKPHKARPTKH